MEIGTWHAIEIGTWYAIEIGTLYAIDNVLGNEKLANQLCRKETNERFFRFTMDSNLS